MGTTPAANAQVTQEYVGGKPAVGFVILNSSGVIIDSFGGAPGGSSGQIQYNNAGAFGGLDSSGTGNVVRATGPTLVTPTLGAAVFTTLTGAQSINATSTDGVVLSNPDTATVGAQKWSPRLHFTGSGWKTNSTAAGQVVDWIAELVPVQGAAAPTANFVVSSQVNAGGYTAGLTVASPATLAQVANSTLVTIGSSASTGVIAGTASGLYLGRADAPYSVFIGYSSGYMMTMGSDGRFGWSSSVSGAGSALTSQDTVLTREGAAIIQMGLDVNGPPVTQTLKSHDGITGTDVVGATLQLASGRGTGAGAVSSLIFQTPTVLGSGTTAQSLATRLTLSSAGLTIPDAHDLLINATTGTKFGQSTSKLGFYGAAPIVQAVLATGAGATVDNVITALQNLGMVKQS